MKTLALLALALGLASCSPLRVSRQELWMRHDAARDRVDLLVLSEGVSARGATDASALELARRILDGKKVIQVLDWPWGDLEAFTRDPDEERRALVQPIVDALEVRWGEAYLDEQGRLSWAQHLRLRDAARTMDALDRLLRASFSAPDDPNETDPLERAQAERFRRAAAAGWEFVSFDGQQLRVRLPLIDAEAGALAAFVRANQTQATPWMIAFEGEATVLVLGQPEDACTRFVLPGDDAYDHELLRELWKEGRVAAQRTRAALIERFRKECASDGVESDEGRRPIEEVRR